MKNCRECGHEVSEQANTCPKCGAPRPAKAVLDGYGFEYKSPVKLLGIPLIHISFKYSPNKIPVVARGIIAIGQFAVGFITIAQIGIGFIGAGQIIAAFYALAQVGLCIFRGYGQVIRTLF
ncbi:zinc ribbon domain-containing protein [bacterium]|nr:zinc ribbon domain-containing protein [bacterium]